MPESERNSPATLPRDTRLRPQVLLLGFAALLNDVSSEMIFPLLPVFLAATLGASPFVIGMIEGSADALASVLKLFAGKWSDRMAKRKPLIVGGYALAALARGLIGTAGHWPSVFAARLVDRTGKGIRSAPRDAMISDVTPPASRGKAFGFHRALDHTGAIAGPLLTVLLMRGAGMSMRATFLVAIIPAVIGVTMLAMLLTETPRPPAAATDSLQPRIVLPPSFWNAIAAVSLFSLANSSDVFLLLQAHAAGVETPMLPLLWAAHHVIKALFSTMAGSLSDRIDRRLLLIAGWSMYALIYFVFPRVTSMAAFFALFIIYAVPFTLTEGAERAWIADLVPDRARGQSFGIYYLANGLCILAGTALFGLIYEHASHEAAFYAGATLALAAALLVGIQTATAAPRPSAAA